MKTKKHGLARGLARAGGGNAFFQNLLGNGGVFLKELLEFVAHNAVHHRTDVAVAELGFCLALKLRVFELDGNSEAAENTGECRLLTKS